LVVVSSVVPQDRTSDSSPSRPNSKADVLQVYSEASSPPSDDSCTNAKTSSAAHSACAGPHCTPQSSRRYDDSATNAKAGSPPSTSNFTSQPSGDDDDSVAYSTACSASASNFAPHLSGDDDDSVAYSTAGSATAHDSSTYHEDDANTATYPSPNDDATIETADSTNQFPYAIADTSTHTVTGKSAHSIANASSVNAQPRQ
jgi:hypothetical protein